MQSAGGGSGGWGQQGVFHLVLCQGSGLGLDEQSVSFSKCELISLFPVEKQVPKEKAAMALPSGNSVKGRFVSRKEKGS